MGVEVGKLTRRTFVEHALLGSGLILDFPAGAASLSLTPAAARARELPLRTLSEAQAAAIELLGETILPGAAHLGLVHFIDHQLSVDPADALLIARFFELAPPFKSFYESGVAATMKMAEQAAQKKLLEMNPTDLDSLVARIAVPGATYADFPVNLFYMCLRSDAVDVMYGNPAGFALLDIPYMQHILPPSAWDN